MFWGFLFLSIIPVSPAAAPAEGSRVQQYAAYRAHTILPQSLRDLVKRHGKFLFEGLERGLKVPSSQVNHTRIIVETQKITDLINKQANFRVVIRQMGFVSGLLATLSDPTIGRDARIHRGFHYYLQKKLKRFLFVFDGYPDQKITVAALQPRIAEMRTKRKQYGDILDRQYREVAYNTRYMFDERSGVFGVCSIYFSKLAGTSAQLWYHAWQNANGDMSKTPFVKKNRRNLVKKSP